VRVSAPLESMPRLERVRLDAVTVRLGGHVVLRDLSLSFGAGEHVCVRGGNGAGKTTLLRLVAGALRPWRGTRSGPRACAYVPPALAPPAMTVAGWMREVRRERVDDPDAALARLGFDDDARASCRELSFGNLRKVLLADACTARTDVVAIDEVHVGLDHAGRAGLEELMAGARARGATVVVAAQDDDVVNDADRTLVVRDGQVTDAGPTGDTVRHTLRGPRSGESALLDAAERLGFRVVDGDDR